MYSIYMARYSSRRKTVRPFRAMKKARTYSSRGYAAFGRRVGKYLVNRVKNPVHWFKKQIDGGLILSTGADRHLTYQFTYNALDEYKEMTELYDQYLLRKITLSLEPVFNAANVATTVPRQAWMRIVHDYDDVVPLTTESQYLEYNNCKSRLMTGARVIRTVLYPKVLKPALEVGGTPVYSGAKPGWISTDFDNVAHLGLKVFVPDNGTPVGYGLFKVRITYDIGFKNSR